MSKIYFVFYKSKSFSKMLVGFDEQKLKENLQQLLFANDILDIREIKTIEYEQKDVIIKLNDTSALITSDFFQKEDNFIGQSHKAVYERYLFLNNLTEEDYSWKRFNNTVRKNLNLQTRQKYEPGKGHITIWMKKRK